VNPASPDLLATAAADSAAVPLVVFLLHVKSDVKKADPLYIKT
jgi:hypothetical protein